MEPLDRDSSGLEIPKGKVVQARKEWLLRTDEELAQRLQEEEVTTHLLHNSSRNQQIRKDFPTAAAAQSNILEMEERRASIRMQQTREDEYFARELQMKMKTDLSSHKNSSRRVSNHERDTVAIGIPSNDHVLELPPRNSESINNNDLHELGDALGICHEELLQQQQKMLQEQRDAEMARLLNTAETSQNSDERIARRLQKKEYRNAKEKQKNKVSKNNNEIEIIYADPADRLPDPNSLYADPLQTLSTLEGEGSRSHRAPPEPPHHSGRPRLAEPEPKYPDESHCQTVTVDNNTNSKSLQKKKGCTLL